MKVNQFLNENLLFGRALVDLEVSNKGSNPLWTGFVSTFDGEIPAYIKKCRNQNGLCIEIITSLLGLSLNLPIPKPIVVLVEPDHPQIAVSEPTLLFGSQMYDMPSFERFLRDSDLTEECILDYPNMPLVVAFDELIANPDRNNSNILYDGESFRFIDHEKAFHQQQHPKLPINEANKIGNLSDIVQHYKGQNDVYIHKLMLKIKKVISEEINTTNLDVILTEAKSNIALSDYNTLINHIGNFLTARHGVLATLVESAITSPPDTQQLELIGG